MKFYHATKRGIRINRPHGDGELVFKNHYCLLPDDGDPRDREFLESYPGVLMVEAPAPSPELKQDKPQEPAARPVPKMKRKTGTRGGRL